MALGIFICRPPWSLRKAKSAVDVLGDICQASLLHLTKADVSGLNSFSGQIITGPEKAKRGARVHSISLRLFSIERSLFLRRKHANSVIPSITYRLWAVLSSLMLNRMPRSRIGVRPWITFRSVPLYLISEGFHVCWCSKQGGQPFWQKSGKQWALQLCGSLAEPAQASAAGNFFWKVLVRRRATLREFSAVFESFYTFQK